MELLKTGAEHCRNKRDLVLRLIIVTFLVVAARSGEAQNVGSASDGFDPNADHWIWAMERQEDGGLLVGGGFTTIGGLSRNGLARLHSDGSVDTAFVANVDGTINPVFNPLSNNWVLALALQEDGKILVGGGFTSIGGTVRNGLARLNADGTVDSTFNPDVNGSVMSIAVQEDGAVVIGGFFDMVGGVSRNYIARLNSDGSLDTDFNPGSNGEVEQLAIQEDGKIIAVGGFTSFGGATRNRIARIHTDGTLDSGFDPSADGAVYCVAIQPDQKILIGGPFTEIDTVTRNRIARLDEDGTLDATFDPSANDNVEALSILADGRILVSGAFSQISGQAQGYSAVLFPDGTADSAYSPTVGSTVRSQVAEPDGKVLLGGQFTSVGGETRNHIARVHPDGSVEKDFNPGPNHIVDVIALQRDGKILMGGSFTSVDGQTRNHIARLNADGSLDSSFDPDSDGRIYCMAVQVDGKIVIGGQFTSIGGETRNCIARLEADGSLDAAFNPGASAAVFSLVVQADGKILVGGNFNSLGGQTRNYLARLNTDGSVDVGFDPNAGGGGPITSLAVQEDGWILLGGSFTKVGVQDRNRIARIEPSGSLDDTFTPNSGGEVHAIAIQADGKILLGGAFTTMDGQGRSHIARVDEDGVVDAAFNPGAGAVVRALALQTDGKILVGGEFTSIGGQGRSYVARLNTDGSADSLFNPGASSTVHAFAVQKDGKILTAGYFNNIGGQTRTRIARLTNTVAHQGLTSSRNGSSLTWERSGTSPKIDRVTFESSTDGGTTWSDLGAGFRIGDTGSWRLNGLSLPPGQNLLVRASGRQLSNSAFYGSSSVYESVLQVNLPSPPGIPDLESISDSGSSDTDNVTSNTTPTFSGTAAPGATVLLFSDSLPFPIGDGIADASGDWSVMVEDSLPDGLHQITATANGSAASAGLDVVIDTVGPDVTIAPASGQANPASGAPVNFDVVFSEEVTGFDSGDLSLSGSTMPASPSVSGGPANYIATVGTVSGGEGTVTVSISSDVATDVAGNGNASSGSSNATVAIDTHGNTAGTATAVDISSGSGSASGFLSPGDLDVFTFTMSEARHIQIGTMGTTDTFGWIRNAAGDLLNDPDADNDRVVSTDLNFEINLVLLPGTYTIEVGGNNDVQTGAYELEITVGDEPGFQPDNGVGRSAASTIGNNIYNTAAGQTVSLTSKKARTVRGVVAVENDGDVPDNFIMSGSRGNRFFKTTYTSSAGNVTAALVAGTYQTGELAPDDQAHVVTARVKPNKRKIVKKVKRGGRRKLKVKRKRFTASFESVSGSDGNFSDTGYIRVRTK